jgi:putative transposase
MSGSVQESVLATVNSEPGITLAELLDQVRGSSPGDVFRLLSDGAVFIDLATTFVGDQDRVRVFKDETTAKFLSCVAEAQSGPPAEAGIEDLAPGTTLLFDSEPLEVIHVGATEITFYRKKHNDFPSLPRPEVEKRIKSGKITNISNPRGSSLDRKSTAYKAAIENLGTKDQLSEAILRYETIIKPHREGRPITACALSSRTQRTVIKNYNFAESECGNGLRGLLLKTHLKGNRSDRLEKINPKLRKLLNDFLDKKVETPRCETKTAAYGQFVKLCHKKKMKETSWATFKKEWKKREGPKQTEKMEGSKAAYPLEEFLDADIEEASIEGWDSEVPVHGDYPWEYAHIDHTLMDVVLRHTDKGVIMGRAWVTLLIDSCSRLVLAYYITYDSPSYRSCMGVIRECVRVHARLPECMIVDGGIEFKSIYFQTLMARRNVNIIWRPATKPRFGAVIERFIHTLNKQFLHNLMGNTKIMKNVRRVSKSVNPKNLARWNFPMLDEHLEKYLYKEYAKREHSSLGQTPQQAFDEGLARFGRPESNPIKYDDAFLIDTMPSTRKGTAKLIRSRGFKIYGVYYRSRELRRSELLGKLFEVRYDPWNMAHAYAWVKNRWVVCYAPRAIYAKLKNRSEREVKYITEQHRQSYKNYGRNFKTRAIEIGENLADKKAAEELEMQRLKDQEIRTSALKGGRRLSPSDKQKQEKNRSSRTPEHGSRKVY